MRVPDCAVAVGVRCQDGFSVRAKHTCIHETGVSAQFAERLPRRDFPHARVIARADDQRSLPIPAELGHDDFTAFGRKLPNECAGVHAPQARYGIAGRHLLHPADVSNWELSGLNAARVAPPTMPFFHECASIL
jgi:hypothetical protein